MRKTTYKRRSISDFKSTTVMVLVTLLLVSFLGRSQSMESETFPPLNGAEAPQTLDELWSGFDPRAEALDIEVMKEWEEDGVVMRVLRYRIGIFKGKKAMMAAIYGFPKNAKNLPGLVQIHGGGQYADYRAVLTNAKRGYATISISWAGRINAPDYKVDPSVVKLFWEEDTTNADYKITTDWGALDGYHAPCRNPENNFNGVARASWTLDSVESPRNNPWFLAAVGARRALTFLEQQPEVNSELLGVYGHSMGGKLTVLTAIDPRVKAAAPSCGGISNNDNENDLYQKTIADDVYLKEITCPTIFLSPSNDFHGHLQDIPKAIELMKTDHWRVVSAPHHSHQDHGNFEVPGLLWFDQYLKGTFMYPETPTTELELKTKSGIPSFTVKPDPSKQILEVDIYYTQQGENIRNISDRENRINRFWHHANAIKKGNTWTADLPLSSSEKPIWAYANIRYPLDHPVTGAGYYYRVYTVKDFNLSSPIQVATSDQLEAAGIKATLKSSLIIENFEGDWQKDWFAYKPLKWEMATHKIYNDLWKAPKKALLEFSVFTVKSNKLVVSSSSFALEVQLNGGDTWQKVTLSAQSLQNALGESLMDWSLAKELKFSANGSFRERAEGQTQKIDLGGEWNGEQPKFKNLKWNPN